MSPEIASRLGYRVWETTNGGWGRPGTREVWLACPRSWPFNVRPAKQHLTQEDALAFVASEVASKLGISVEDLDIHLRRVTA